jgi:hypothetical protein
VFGPDDEFQANALVRIRPATLPVFPRERNVDSNQRLFSKKLAPQAGFEPSNPPVNSNRGAWRRRWTQKLVEYGGLMGW